MQKRLLDLLCDPIDKSELKLINAIYDENNHIVEGSLVSENGNSYPIVNGIPRFIEQKKHLQKSVESFGDQWNDFNFDKNKWSWLAHTVGHTFGTPEHFKGKVVVDCGAGHGMQSKWMSESGADYVIALELSHAVDDVFQRNLKDVNNVDVVQCSIDMPPLKDKCIEDGVVICHNVIQHTPSVEKTAKALWDITGSGSEFVFNCYQKYTPDFLRRIRWYIYKAQRFVLSKLSFKMRYKYCQFVCSLRVLPLLGAVLEKLMIAMHGDMQGRSSIEDRYNVCMLTTFDYYGSHDYQHHLTDEEVVALSTKLQPDNSKIKNQELFYSKPQAIGAGLRLFR